jgi:hypothetical protein
VGRILLMPDHRSARRKEGPMQLSGQHAARVPRQRLLIVVAGSVQAAG